MRHDANVQGVLGFSADSESVIVPGLGLECLRLRNTVRARTRRKCGPDRGFIRATGMGTGTAEYVKYL